MSPSEFAAKWSGSTSTERAASQEHFIDLCRMLGYPTPNDDPTDEHYAFEKGAEKTSGGDGFADVWKKDHFAWEYKGKRANLPAAYKQLLDYREALENPPLLIVCDLDRFEVHSKRDPWIGRRRGSFRPPVGNPLRARLSSTTRRTHSDCSCPSTGSAERVRERLAPDVDGARLGLGGCCRRD